MAICCAARPVSQANLVMSSLIPMESGADVAARGCWETIASNRAGMRYYAEIANKSVSSFDDLIHLAKENDSSARQALKTMCKALGRGMHMIALALAPGEIVVVGDITNVWELAGPVIERRDAQLSIGPCSKCSSRSRRKQRTTSQRGCSDYEFKGALTFDCLKVQEDNLVFFRTLGAYPQKCRSSSITVDLKRTSLPEDGLEIS